MRIAVINETSAADRNADILAALDGRGFEIINACMKKPRDIAKLRYWCIRRKGEGASVNEICTSAQIPRRTFYNWWNRYRRFGLEGPKPNPRHPAQPTE